MRHDTRRRLGALLAAALVVQVSGCGTLLYPERKGQKDGKVDTTVAILDGIGLLLFIIPGVIAFVVDFDNGTIYLPGTTREHRDSHRDEDSRLGTPDAEPWTTVQVGPDDLDATTIRDVVGRNTGQWLRMDDPRFQVTRVATVSDLPGGFGDASR